MCPKPHLWKSIEANETAGGVDILAIRDDGKIFGVFIARLLQEGKKDDLGLAKALDVLQKKLKEE